MANFAHLSYSLSYTLSLLPPSFLFKFPPCLAFPSSSIKREFLLLSLLIGLELVVEILWTGMDEVLDLGVKDILQLVILLLKEVLLTCVSR